MELIIYITQMDDKAIEGLIIVGVLLLILIIGSLIPSKKQNLKSEEEEEEEKYLESVVDQFKASIRLINLKNMQKRSGKNYSKSINRQKKLINSLKRKQKTKKIKLELKTNFKN